MNRERIDIAIVTIIPVELAAALAALAIPDSVRKKDQDGTIYYRWTVHSELQLRDYELVLVCIGTAGITSAAAVTSAIIERFRPRVVVLMGIAAGIRDKLKVGEVIFSERVIAYEPAALVRSSEGTSYEEPRPDVEQLPYAILQDVANYQPDLERIRRHFEAIGGTFPRAPSGKEEEYNANVVSTPVVKLRTIASGEKLLRDPTILQGFRQLHGKAEVGEMEAAGFVEACRQAGIGWLVIRGISDFGDELKDDRFHTFAAQMAAVVLVDFIKYGLDIRVPSDRLEPTSQPESASLTLSSPVIDHAFSQYLTFFVGREDELANIIDSLRKPDCRLLTLVGPGGIGKTCLAVEAAKQLTGYFKDGTYVVQLAPIISSDFVLTTIIESIKMPIDSQKDLKTQLLTYLQHKRVLLVMDNLEHVLDGIGILLDILQCSPGTKILATSRQRLNVQPEWLLDVDGLQCPDMEDVGTLTKYSAAQLFLRNVARLGFVLPLSESNKRAVVRICRLLHGLPLGIELAAPSIRVLDCNEIANEIERSLDFLATEMRDIPERHRSLRAVFEQSWKLLSEEERLVFSRLSVFRGGFEREAAERVAHASLPIIARLADQSLLRRSGARYEILEVLRQYAEKKLAEDSSQQQTVKDLHAEYYVQFMQNREVLLKGSGQQIAVDEVTKEIENIRSAWQWILSRRKIALIEKCLESFLLFFNHRNWFEEASDSFQKAAELVEADPPGALRNRVLSKIYWYQSRASHALSRYAEAEDYCKKSLAVLQSNTDSADNDYQKAKIIKELAAIYYSMGKYVQARKTFQSSYKLSKQIKAPDLLALSLLRLGDIASVTGYFDASKRYLQQSLALLRELNDQQQLTLCLSVLGDTLCKIGEYTESLKRFQESLAISESIHDLWNTGIAATHLGRVYGLLGNFKEAERLCRWGLALFQKVEYTWSEIFASNHLAKVLYLAGNYAEAERILRENLSLCRAKNYLWHLCFLLNVLGKIERESGNVLQAKEKFRESLEIAMKINALPLVLDNLVQIAMTPGEEINRDVVIAIVTFVLRHTATEKETENDARKMLAEVADEQVQHTILQTAHKKRNVDVKKFVKAVSEHFLSSI